MVSGLIRNQLPGNRLRVRLPCPPLSILGSSEVTAVQSFAIGGNFGTLNCAKGCAKPIL